MVIEICLVGHGGASDAPPCTRDRTPPPLSAHLHELPGQQAPDHICSSFFQHHALTLVISAPSWPAIVGAPHLSRRGAYLQTSLLEPAVPFHLKNNRRSVEPRAMAVRRQEWRSTGAAGTNHMPGRCMRACRHPSIMRQNSISAKNARPLALAPRSTCPGWCTACCWQTARGDLEGKPDEWCTHGTVVTSRHARLGA